jgi:S1-C subfamily serine protease
MDELVNVVNGKKPGEEIEVTLMRGGQQKTVTVKLGNRPASVK